MDPNEPPAPEQNQDQDPNPLVAALELPPVAANPPAEDLAAADLARRTCPVCFRVFDSVKAMWGHSWVHRQRDQIYAMPPPPQAAGGGGVVGTGGPVAVALAAEPVNRWIPWKIDSRDERDRTCPRCSRVFGSPKAMFGHLHVHYERSGPRRRRGPPRIEEPEPEPEPVAEPEAEGEPEIVVIEVEDDDDEVVEIGGGDSPVSINLNLPTTDDCGGDDNEVDGDEYFPIDLNKTPPSA